MPNTDVKIGGTKKIKIERVRLTDPGYSKRALMPEEYPFSLLEPAVKLDNGDIEGDSFFIPASDNPQTHLARSRKQLKDRGYAFWTRKDYLKNADGTPELDENGDAIFGLRIWRANSAIDSAVAARPEKAKAEVAAKSAAPKKTPARRSTAKKTAAPKAA